MEFDGARTSESVKRSKLCGPGYKFCDVNANVCISSGYMLKIGLCSLFSTHPVTHNAFGAIPG